MKRLRSVPIAIAVGVGLTIGLLFLIGAPPLEALQVVFDGAFGNRSRIAATLMAWVPLVLAAAGLLVTFQGGLWNIGVEGQIAMGAIGAAWVARTVEGPSGVVVPLTLLGGAVFGIAWALVPAWLRTRFRVHEIFSGVALSFVAGAIAVYLIIGPWSRTGVASTSGTDLFDSRSWLPEFGGWRVSPVGLLLAVAAVLAVWGLLRGSRFGLRLRAVGRNPESAFLLGIGTGRHLVVAFALCGALAGIAGTVQATGFHHKLVPSISGGYGFLAVLVVLLSGFRAAWIAPIALFFAAIQVGSTQLSLRLGIDSSLAGVIQGILVMSVLIVGGLQVYSAARGPVVTEEEG
ncbi:MAG TPA: ABC transporter permease [Acidimicrobiia bacterium]|nr:ABC transporter permease [Acidimicrobiia bacterium]